MIEPLVPFSLTRKERKILTALLILFLLGLLGMWLLDGPEDFGAEPVHEGFSRPVLPLSAQSRA